MSTSITFELTLRSDYHVGSGHRKGTETDSALLREAGGQPALRGSALGQLLRDSARELLTTGALSGKPYARCAASGGPDEPDYCGQWNPSEPECPICRVFGTPRAPRRWKFSSAWLKETSASEPARAHQDWGAEPTTRVRVSPAARRAEPGKLFNEEVGDSRLAFCFEARWEGEGVPDKADIALLAAAARNVRRLGRGRRRGRGECSMRVAAVDGYSPETDWLSLFEETWIEREWKPVSMPAIRHSLSLLEEQPLGDWDQPARMRIIARLDEPLLVARRAQAGIFYESVALLPGTVLLGALAARIDLNDPDRFRLYAALFRHGQLRASFLSLAHRQSGGWLYPAFAPPLDVFRCKQHPSTDRSGGHPDRAFALANGAAIHCPLCAAEYGENDAAVETIDDLLVYRGRKIESVRPTWREEMHIRMNAKTQRVLTGALFGYVALEAGQYLTGELVCRNKETWASLRELANLPADGTPAQLWLGKAIRRGYGRVSVVFDPDDQYPPLLPALRERLPNPTAPFTLLLTGDTIIADEWGRFPAGFEAGWLSEALGLSVAMQRGFAKSIDVDAFNSYIGLPRWRDRALKAGSAAGLQVADESLSPDAIWQKLAQAELRGIGLRRAEGYGQVVVNHPLYAALDGAPTARYVGLQLQDDRFKAGSLASHPIEAEESFRRQWERTLGDDWEAAEHVEFGAVARLLRSGRDVPITDLLAQMDALGRPEPDSDPHPLPGRWLNRDDVRGVRVKRSPKPFFQERGNGHAGYAKIRDLLKKLGETQDDARLRSIGVEMLATKTAEAVKRAQKKETKR